jgi:predicted DsbA family dithiol-disulfide isomerase
VLVDEAQGDGAAGKAAQAYGATGWPYFVIVGADGKVKVRVSGEVEVADLEKIVAEALAS